MNLPEIKIPNTLPSRIILDMAAKDDEKMEEGNKDKIYPSDCNEYKTESLTGRNINYTGI